MIGRSAKVPAELGAVVAEAACPGINKPKQQVNPNPGTSKSRQPKQMKTRSRHQQSPVAEHLTHGNITLGLVHGCIWQCCDLKGRRHKKRHNRPQQRHLKPCQAVTGPSRKT